MSSPPSACGDVAAQGGEHEQQPEHDGDRADDVGEEARADRVAEADPQGRRVIEGVGADDDEHRGQAELGKVPLGCGRRLLRRVRGVE